MHGYGYLTVCEQSRVYHELNINQCINVFCYHQGRSVTWPVFKKCLFLFCLMTQISCLYMHTCAHAHLCVCGAVRCSAVCHRDYFIWQGNIQCMQQPIIIHTSAHARKIVCCKSGLIITVDLTVMCKIQQRGITSATCRKLWTGLTTSYQVSLYDWIVQWNIHLALGWTLKRWHLCLKLHGKRSVTEVLA